MNIMDYANFINVGDNRECVSGYFHHGDVNDRPRLQQYSRDSSGTHRDCQRNDTQKYAGKSIYICDNYYTKLVDILADQELPPPPPLPLPLGMSSAGVIGAAYDPGHYQASLSTPPPHAKREGER